MSPGTIVALEFVTTFGVPVWLCLRPMSASRGGDDRRRRTDPAPVPPTSPVPVDVAPRPLPDCLMLRPAPVLAETRRELEPA